MINMDMSFSNHALMRMSDFAIMFNKNRLVGQTPDCSPVSLEAEVSSLVLFIDVFFIYFFALSP